MPSIETPKLIKPFEIPDTKFPVPFGMDRHLAVSLPLTFEVRLEWLSDIDRNRNKVEVNGILLTPPDHGKDLQVPIDELCQLMLAMAHVHAEEDEAEDPRTYRVRQNYKDASGKPHSKFWKLEIKPPGWESLRGRGEDGSDHHAMDEGTSLMEFQQRAWERQQRQQSEASGMAMRQLETTLTTILKANSQVLSEQRLMNEENRVGLREARAQTSQAQDRLFKMAVALTANNEHQEQIQQKSMEMFSMGWSWYMYSMHQQSVLQERRHRDELARLSEAKKEDGKWNWVGQFAPALLSFGGGILTKMGMPIGEVLTEAGADAAAAAAGSETAASGGFETGPAPGKPAPEVRVHPEPQPEPQPTPQPADSSLAGKSRHFGTLFSADAWKTLEAGLSEDQLRSLKALVSVTDDAIVGPAMMAFTGQLQMGKAGAQCLDSVLTKVQVDLINEIMGTLQAGMPNSHGPQSPVEPQQPPAPPKPDDPTMAPTISPPSSINGRRSRQIEDEPESKPADFSEPPHLEESLVELREILATVRGMNPAAREHLESYGSVEALAAASDEDLLGIQGIGAVVLRRLRDKIEI